MSEDENVLDKTDELKKKGIISPMEIKAVIMNHNDLEFADRMEQIRKGGYGKEAFQIEKDYIHVSDKRLDFIKKVVDKCEANTLLLFHTIEYGQKIFNKYGSWSILFAWIPIIGDPITVLSGVLKVNFLKFVVLVTISKVSRYIFLIYLIN